jgi:hypothetical protein
VIPVWTVPRDEGLTGAFAWGGFVIGSNLDLPRLAPTDALIDLSFKWRLDRAPARGRARRREEIKTRTGIVRIETWSDARIRYQVDTVGLYEVRAEEEVIDFFPFPGADPMQVEHHLLNAVLPIFAGLRAVVCLHASAVVEAGQATVFAGPSGSGKSTRAWKAVSRGGRLLGDDVAALRSTENGWLVYPCTTTLRLAHLPAAPSWRFGPKTEAHVASSMAPARLGQLFVLGRAASTAPGSQGGVDLLRALLALQAGWVCGDTRTRRSILEETAALCECIELGTV